MMKNKMKHNGPRSMVSIREVAGNRQANNLLDSHLAEVIRPWFSPDDQSRFAWALAALDRPQHREDAAACLGIKIVPAV